MEELCQLQCLIFLLTSLLSVPCVLLDCITVVASCLTSLWLKGKNMSSSRVKKVHVWMSRDRVFCLIAVILQGKSLWSWLICMYFGSQDERRANLHMAQPNVPVRKTGVSRVEYCDTSGCRVEM
jgi:hypothetical protein